VNSHALLGVEKCNFCVLYELFRKSKHLLALGGFGAQDSKSAELKLPEKRLEAYM